MNDFKHVLGLLSRDMLLSRGHFMTVRNLDGGAQHDRPAPTRRPRTEPRTAASNGPCLPGESCTR